MGVSEELRYRTTKKTRRAATPRTTGEAILKNEKDEDAEKLLGNKTRPTFPHLLTKSYAVTGSARTKPFALRTPAEL